MRREDAAEYERQSICSYGSRYSDLATNHPGPEELSRVYEDPKEQDEHQPEFEDPAFQHKVAARERYERHDNVYVRFVLGRVEDSTR